MINYDDDAKYLCFLCLYEALSHIMYVFLTHFNTVFVHNGSENRLLFTYTVPDKKTSFSVSLLNIYANP